MAVRKNQEPAAGRMADDEVWRDLWGTFPRDGNGSSPSDRCRFTRYLRPEASHLPAKRSP